MLSVWCQPMNERFVLVAVAVLRLNEEYGGALGATAEGSGQRQQLSKLDCPVVDLRKKRFSVQVHSFATQKSTAA